MRGEFRLFVVDFTGTDGSHHLAGMRDMPIPKEAGTVKITTIYFLPQP
jgi:hypothetical protein